MTRKTDDNVILQMLSEGKTQKEIAEFFDVSSAAICKRVKRLLTKKPESLDRLTERQKRFALAIAEGKSQTRAALDSHECRSLDSAKSLGYQLMQKPDIQMAVADLMQEEGLTRRHRVRTLKKHIDHPDPNVSLKGLDQSWKLDGAYKEEQVHVHLSYDDMVKAHEQTRARIREVRKQLGLDPNTIEGEVIDDDEDDKD